MGSHDDEMEHFWLMQDEKKKCMWRENVERPDSASEIQELYTATSPVSANAGKVVWVSSGELQISVDKTLWVLGVQMSKRIVGRGLEKLETTAFGGRM